MNKKRGFSITELLVSIAIIGILTALIVPGVDRAMNKNHLPNDIKVIQAKFEETRTMSASRSADQGGINYDEISSKTKKVGFYGVYIPRGTDLSEYYVVKLSSYNNLFKVSSQVDPSLKTPEYCWMDDIVSKKSECILETIKLSKGVTYTNTIPNPYVYLYTVPKQGYYVINLNNGVYLGSSSSIKMTQGKRQAVVSIGGSSAMINVTYSTLP